jgi:predicted TPR repeat methyltransferase
MTNEASLPVHDFDAGELGCGTGLPGEVRRRLAALAMLCFFRERMVVDVNSALR